MKELFAVIEKSSNYRFLYDASDIDVNNPVSAVYANTSIERILKEKLAHLSYEVKGNQIVVKSKPERVISQQQRQQMITGTVTDINGDLLPGVNISIKGTTSGVISDIDGKYAINVPGSDAVLVFSFVGFITQEIKVSDQTYAKISMREDAQQIREVVITALEIKRDAKSLSYSVSTVKGDELESAHETNLANALSGKVAGVFVNRPASGASGSARVNIRGVNSLSTNSQPLYVIDGMPINNNTTDIPGWRGGFDYGDGISNINPNDIESISVLKGPNATALYGNEGGNGVILITTKSGTRRKGVGIQFSSDFSMGNGLVLPDFQNVYGVGYNGDFTHFRGDDDKIYSMDQAKTLGISGIPKASNGRDKLTRGSWGAKMDGQRYEDAYGNILDFVTQADTYDFYNTEMNYVNNLSFDGSTDKLKYRFSVSNTYNDGYYPTNTLNRNSFNLKLTADITKKLQLEVMGDYINQKVENRPKLADAPTNAAYLLISMPRSMPLETLKSYEWTQEEIDRQLGFSSSSLEPGMEKGYATNSSTGNPYWTYNKERNEDTRNRVIGYVKLSYELFPWLRLTARVNTDYIADRRLFWRAEGTWDSTNKKGDYKEYYDESKRTSAEFRALSNFKLSDNFDVSLNIGGNRSRYSSKRIGYSGEEFIEPNLYVIQNVRTLNYVSGIGESAVNSLYGTGQVGFRNYLYVDFSGRNDWSSSLPIQNCSYFYPSVGGSFLLTEAFNIGNKWLNFLKVRASIAQAGAGGGSSVGTYSLDGSKHNGVTLASYSNTIYDPNLKSELTTSYEGGFDVNLFNNRLALNVTAYRASTENQVLSITLPASTTFERMLTNAGEIENRGMEIMISGTPVKTMNGITWESSFNFARNRNKIIELVEGTDTYLLAEDRGVNVVAEPGKAFGQIKGVKWAWLKDEQGNRLIDPDTGLPLHTSDFVTTDLGNALPQWLGGFANTFTYKGFRLYALIDISQGAKVFSQSVREGILYGVTQKTLAGRDGTYVAEGMLATKDASGNYVSTGIKNTKQVRAQDYWNTVAVDKENFVSEELINDLSYVAMREITLSYTLPASLLDKSLIHNAVVSLYGRNLFYFQRKTDGFSPEACSWNTHNSSIGLESTAMPLMRTFGVNVILGF
ncbi:MAG: SusC/RagA family TonB-linked outer membrane protein [Tannerellaceae bacterium]|nr:SusC/RagA family TonB-linked outer membrane protein [Tannerellaceae bacterium]